MQFQHFIVSSLVPQLSATNSAICVLLLVAQSSYPLWWSSNIRRVLLLQPQSAGCRNARRHYSDLQCSRPRHQVMCLQHQVGITSQKKKKKKVCANIFTLPTSHLLHHIYYTPDFNQWYACMWLRVCEFPSESPSRHIGPVWQLKWCHQSLDFSTKKDCVDSLFSQAADGRTCRWNQGSSGLDCIGITTSLL